MRSIAPADRPWRRRLHEVNDEPAPWVYKYPARWLAKLVLPLFIRRHWLGQEHVPHEGGVIFVGNHISNADPIPVAEYLVWAGRWPRFLGKAEVWRWPVIGWIARTTGQIPVYRDSERAGDSLVEARRALAEGLAIFIYPEGTITDDPDLWPMTGRRGAALLALETGAPVVPVAQWGAHHIMGGRYVEWRRLLGGRRDVVILAGPPVDLTEFRARMPAHREAPKELLDEVTDHLLDVLTHMVAELRDEPSPDGRWDMRVGRRVTKLA